MKKQTNKKNDKRRYSIVLGYQSIKRFPPLCKINEKAVDIYHSIALFKKKKCSKSAHLSKFCNKVGATPSMVGLARPSIR